MQAVEAVAADVMDDLGRLPDARDQSELVRLDVLPGQGVLQSQEHVVVAAARAPAGNRNNFV